MYDQLIKNLAKLPEIIASNQRCKEIDKRAEKLGMFNKKGE